MKAKLIRLLGTGFGAGYLPLIPGTWGTVVAVPLVYFMARLNPLEYMALTLTAVVFGIWLAEICVPLLGGGDAPAFVFDEICGYMITMVWVPFNLKSAFVGFILFRLLDMAKPGPVGYVDRKVKGGFGVMLDDIVAGFIASIFMQVLLAKTSLIS